MTYIEFVNKLEKLNYSNYEIQILVNRSTDIEDSPLLPREPDLLIDQNALNRNKYNSLANKQPKKQTI